MEVNRRILSAPPEFHALRHEKFIRDRENFEKNRYDKANARRMPCGCVVALDGAEKTPVHYCPTHWAQRRNKYASAR